MNTIFKEEEVQKALEVARDWEGTPHRNRIQIKGVGIDCVKFVLMLWVESGVVPAFRMPRYDTNVGRKGAEDIITRNLEAAFELQHLKAKDIQDGDLAIYRANFSCNHVAIYLKGQLWQVLWNRAVEPYELKDQQHLIDRVLRLTSRKIKTTFSGKL